MFHVKHLLKEDTGMKFAKRSIAWLLAMLILGAGFAMPVMAEGNNAMPVITRQPQSIYARHSSRYEFTLSVEAHIPNGDTVGYHWYWEGSINRNPIGGRTNATLTLSAASSGVFDTYYVVVYNADLGREAGYVVSERATVTRRDTTPQDLRSDLRAQFRERPSLREGLRQDPLYLINGMFETLFFGLTYLSYVRMDRRGVTQDQAEQWMARLINWTMPLWLAVLVPYALIALPLSLLLAMVA